MTMIEIIVVLAVMGMLMVVGFMVLRERASLREDATQVTALTRATHNMATMSRQHHRIVFDLDKQVYRVEACEGEVKMTKTDKETQPEEIDPSELPSLQDLTTSTQLPPEVLKSIVGADPDRVAAAIAGKTMPSKCALAESMNDDADGRGNMRSISVDEGVRIRRVHVQHLAEPQLEGIVTVNFFPLGNAEKAVIELTHEDGDQFSVVVYALTGRVELRTGEIDVAEFMHRNAAGDDDTERGQDLR